MSPILANPRGEVSSQGKIMAFLLNSEVAHAREFPDPLKNPRPGRFRLIRKAFHLKSKIKNPPF